MSLGSFPPAPPRSGTEELSCRSLLPSAPLTASQEVDPKVTKAEFCQLARVSRKQKRSWRHQQGVWTGDLDTSAQPCLVWAWDPQNCSWLPGEGWLK